jgi:hypothetical protein
MKKKQHEKNSNPKWEEKQKEPINDTNNSDN